MVQEESQRFGKVAVGIIIFILDLVNRWSFLHYLIHDKCQHDGAVSKKPKDDHKAVESNYADFHHSGQSETFTICSSWKAKIKS